MRVSNSAILRLSPPALPDQFADRAPGPQLEVLRPLAPGGEYEELVDALIASLRKLTRS